MENNNINGEVGIIVLDSKNYYKFDDNPSELKIACGKNNEFKMYERDDENLKKFFIKTEKEDGLMLLNECKENLYLIPSKIFNNRYYPILDYQEFLRWDLAYCIREVAIYMGAKTFNLQITREVKEDNKLQTSSSYKTEKTDFGVINGEKNINEESRKDTHREYSADAMNIELNENFDEKRKKSFDDFKKWIDDKGVNVENLPIEFRDKVKHYLAGNDLGKESIRVSKIETSNQISKASMESVLYIFSETWVDSSFIKGAFKSILGVAEKLIPFKAPAKIVSGAIKDLISGVPKKIFVDGDGRQTKESSSHENEKYNKYVLKYEITFW